MLKFEKEANLTTLDIKEYKKAYIKRTLMRFSDFLRFILVIIKIETHLFSLKTTNTGIRA